MNEGQWWCERCEMVYEHPVWKWVLYRVYVYLFKLINPFFKGIFWLFRLMMQMDNSL
jgi:hypothetical protein